MEQLQNQRAHLCRLTPDRALESPEEAHEFLRDRGMLTRTPDSALPSLFEACHEEPYAAGSRGFGSWPATKYPWYFQLAERPDVHELRVHNGKSILFTDETLALVDPICRAELARMEQDETWASFLLHLANAGPSTLDDLIVAAVRGAVIAPEREIVRAWFSWRWLFDEDLVDRLVSEGRLTRVESGWVTAPACA